MPRKTKNNSKKNMRLKKGSTKKPKSKSKKEARVGVRSGRPETTFYGFGSDVDFSSASPTNTVTGFGVDICDDQKTQKTCNANEGVCLWNIPAKKCHPICRSIKSKRECNNHTNFSNNYIC